MTKAKEKSARELEIRRRAEYIMSQDTTHLTKGNTDVDVQRLVHELQVHQIELEMQNEELRRSREDLEAGLAHYTDLYDFAPVGYLTLDTAGTIRQLNLHAAHLLGMERVTLQNRKLSLSISAMDQPAFTDFLMHVFRSGANEACEVALRNEADVQTYFVRIEGRTDDEGPLCRVMMIDVSERRRVEAALRESDHFRHLIENLHEGIWVIDRTAVTTFVNSHMAEMMGYSVDEMLGKPLLQFAYTDGKQRADLAIGTRRGDVSSYSEYEFTRKNGTRFHAALTNAPLTDANGAIIGAIASVLDISERIRSEAQIRSQLETLKVLYDVARQLPQHLDTHILAADAVRICVEIFGADVAWIGHAERDGQVALMASYPPASEYPHHVVVRWDNTPAGRGPIGTAIRTGAPSICDDLTSSPEFYPSKADAAREHLIGCGSFPLLGHDRPYGALTVYFRKPGQLSEDRVQVFHSYALLLGTALENASLIEETQRRLHHLQAVQTVDLAIAAHLDLPHTLDVVLEQVVLLLHVDAADIVLLDAQDNMLTVAAWTGFKSGHASGIKVSLGSKFAGVAASEQRTVINPGDLVSDCMECDAGFKALIQAEGFVKQVATPLIVNYETEGVLEVFHRTPLVITEEWLSYLETLAGEAAISIDNAALIKRLHRANESLEQAYDGTIVGWSRALDLRDRVTAGHTQRAADLTVVLGQVLGLESEGLVHLRRGALLHDIGKMGVPDAILSKPGPLNEEEWAVMRQHPVLAHDFLMHVDFLRPALDIPYCHHESWDGSGYPRGLKGEDIPLAARIFTVVDMWDALRSDRPYREAWPEAKVRAHLQAQAGVHLDPRVVEEFLRLKIPEA